MLGKIFKKQHKQILSAILSFLLVMFFVPGNIAFAAIPGLTPVASVGSIGFGTNPSPGTADSCFVAKSGGGSSTIDLYCYSTLSTCQSVSSSVTAPAKVIMSCVENFSQASFGTKLFHKATASSPTLANVVDTVENAPGNILLSPIVLLSFLFFKTVGLFLTGMGTLLDMAISGTINSDFYTGLTVINIGWTAVRDFSNLFFIFVLLYIAIMTILGLAGSNTKRWVAHLIIAALLINFSLFTTKIVIDAGNAIAWGFWDQMNVSSGGSSSPSATLNLLQGFKLQSITNPVNSQGQPVSMPATTKIMIYLGGGIMMLVAGYVFLAGAIMMMVRTVTLILLMILSPFAFLGFALPVAGGFANKWVTKLIGSAFVAPAFIAMLYLVSTIINSPDLFKLTNSQGMSIGAALAGDISSYSIIYNYIFLIILVLGALTVANAVSSGAGTQAGNWAKKGLSGGAAATALGIGAAGRQTAGRYGKSRLNNENWVKEQNRLVARAGMKDASFLDKAAGRTANLKLATAQKASKGTFDVRNVNVMGKNINSALGYGGVNAGQGTKRTYDTHGAVGSLVTGGYRGSEKEAELIKTAKERYKTAPDAQEGYLRARLGKSNLEGDDTYDAVRHKDVRNQIERDKVTTEAKAKLKETAEGKIIGEEAAKAIKGAFATLSGKEASEILHDKPEYLKNPAVTAALTSKVLSALDTSKLTPDTIDTIASGVVQNGTDSARKYLKNQAKIGGVLQYNTEGELQKLTNDYNQKKIELKDDATAWNAYAEKQKKEIGKALGMVGGTTEITQLDDKLITHEALVSQYNSKVIREFQKKIKDGEFSGDFGKELDAQLQKVAPEKVASPIIIPDSYRARPA